MIKNTKQKKYYFFIKGNIYTFLSSGIVVSILKRIIGRERPYVSFSPDRFYGLKYLYEHNLLWNSSYHSFPSGHTITIFTTIWFLSFNLKNKIVKLENGELTFCVYPKYQYKGVTIIQQPRMRVHIRLTDFPNSDGLPFDIDLMDTNVQNKIVEFIERDSNMDLYIQFVCNANIVINGVENEYVSTRTVECTNHFLGDAY